jgi:hypothetical protein
MRNALVLALWLITACNQQTSNDAQKAEAPAKPRGVSGYGDLKFGMSFDEAMALTSASMFNPYSLKGCLSERPIRGCTLHPDSDLTAFETVAGIPYGLGLAFNRFDKLTDVDLEFKRRDEEKILKDDCQQIHERTLDWVAKEYGPFGKPRNPEDAKQAKMIRTKSGTPYYAVPSVDNNATLVNMAPVDFSDGTSVIVVGTYILGICDISVSFRDRKDVERWTLAPEREKELNEIISSTEDRNDLENDLEAGE